MIISVNSINRLVSITGTYYVSCEVRTECYIYYVDCMLQTNSAVGDSNSRTTPLVEEEAPFQNT
jgi:hypothetical protein